MCKDFIATLDYELISLSGSHPDNEICDLFPGSAGVTHVVRVIPDGFNNHLKHRKIKVTGRIDADNHNANCNFNGTYTMSSGLEWQCVRTIGINLNELTFDTEEILHISAGSDNIKAIFEENNSWRPGSFDNIKKTDNTNVELTFSIMLY